MADRTPLKVTDHNDIAADDPFAELTRIMGFDPRQPVRQPAGERAAPANKVADEADFDIDLEKELMGEFDAVEDSAPAAQQPPLYRIGQEPAYEVASTPANDDELTASFEQDFVFDDAADHADFAISREPEAEVASEPQFASAQQFDPEPDFTVEPEAAFDDDFDKAVAGSLAVSPLEDDLPIDEEMAASLDQDFLLDHHETADVHQHAVEAVQSASETAFEADFDKAAQMSLEDEMAIDTHEPEQPPVAAEAAEAYAAAPLISEDDFTGHFDQTMADVDLGLGEDLNAGEHEDFQEPEPLVADEPAPAVEMPAEVQHFAVESEPHYAEPVAAQSLDDDFELSFRDALNEEPQAPAEPVAAARPYLIQPAPVAAAPVPPVAAVEPAKPAASERSLEDELNALLGAMTARPMPTVKEAAPAPQPVVRAQPVAQPASYAAPKAVDNFDWDLDKRQASPQPAQPIEADLDDLLASELDRQDFAPSAHSTEPSVDFDDDAFDAAFTKGIEAEHAAAPSVTASAGNPANSLDWPASAEPARSSWSRSTPTSAFSTQPAFAAQPTPVVPQMAAPVAPPQAAAPAYRSEPAVDYAAYARPAAPQSRQHDDVPDVETVDVPERVVALADDLDIPELSFEEDQPAAPAYDDLDAEFASLLTDMNATEIAPATAPNRGYEDDS
ncbi:MAG: SPOR domain-containing protein, partial [Mesorhizobium sp.]|nr:SPOR domain-containing protein [Mesorhizobium sp.]